MALLYMYNIKIGVCIVLTFCCCIYTSAQTIEERISKLEQLEAQRHSSEMSKESSPQIHGILRGKYEFQPDLDAGRFEVRNARLSAEGSLPFRSSYKLEIDLCDESAIKMKDAWVRVTPYRTLRITLGQQRMPFSIDAHRNPSAQYFANRSFIAKQVGDMRDVGAAIGYDIKNKDNRKVLVMDAGMYNGSNLDNQKTAWFTSPAYSARLQYFPVRELAIIPSVQHQLIASREASYTSFDLGAYYEANGFHIEAEYLHKVYADDVFDDCNAINAMAIYRKELKNEKAYFNAISYLLRYDYMDNHSDGKKGFENAGEGSIGSSSSKKLVMSDAQRHRLTAGLTFSVRNKYFPTDIRLNYEKYWYLHNGIAKESEQDKLVVELMIRF